jgi:hypothetical protein
MLSIFNLKDIDKVFINYLNIDDLLNVSKINKYYYKFVSKEYLI